MEIDGFVYVMGLTDGDMFTYDKDLGKSIVWDEYDRMFRFPWVVRTMRWECLSWAVITLMTRPEFFLCPGREKKCPAK